MPEFFQEPPAIANLFTRQPWLRAWLRWRLPAPVAAEIEPELERFGELCAKTLWPLARQAEAAPPVHRAHDAWGRRIDALDVSPAWRALRDVAAFEGLVAIAYAGRDEHARAKQFAKLFLFHPASAFYSCPVAMTDGAARILGSFGTAPAHREALARLTAQAPAQFWISGQWMTERAGGSDVSRTETLAHAEGDGWRLSGPKYFASAADADIALALARKPNAAPGSRGLTLFMAQPRGADGGWNGVELRRLKDKLGTRALPTAELDLIACPAVQIGEDGDGVRTVAAMLNITRLHNAVCASSETAQAVALLADYSAKRIVFGKPLAAHPLQRRLLAELQVEAFASLLLTLELARLLGREEAGTASAEECAALRIMTPVCKIATAEACVRVASAVLEGFGGAGYVEDVGIARILRDAQVFPIWEGPSNVLSLDMLRAARRAGGFDVLLDHLAARLARACAGDAERLAAQVAQCVASLRSEARKLLDGPPDLQEASARDLALHVGALFTAAAGVEWLATGTIASLAPWLAALASRATPWRPASADDLSAWSRLSDLS